MDTDEDDISLTSTIESDHGDDDEFEVDDILAVDDTDPGEPKYLVKWKYYPLFRATLEPEENLPDDVMAIWLEKRNKIMRGEIPPFDLSIWEGAIQEAESQKEDRQRRREAKRKRLAKKHHQPRSTGIAIGMTDSDSSSDEAVEEDDAPDPMRKHAREKPKFKQTIFGTSLPPTASSAPASTTHRPQKAATWTASASRGSASKFGQPQSERKTKASSKPTLTTASGSKGSQPAKLPSIPTPGSSSSPALVLRRTASLDKTPLKSPAVRVQAQAAPPTRKSASISGPSTRMSAAPTLSTERSGRITQEMASGLKPAKKPTAKKSKQILGNVFVSGNVRKQKPTLADHFKNPSMATQPEKPKHFNKLSIMRKAQLRGREMTDGHVPFAELPRGLLGPTAEAARNEREESELFVTSRMESEEAEYVLAMKVEPEPEPQPNVQAQPPSKKRKSVRFTDEPVVTEQTMLTDEPVSLSETLEPMETSIDIRKLATVGSLISEVHLLFEDVPQDSSLAWATEFSNMETLGFHSVCQAQNIQGRAQLDPVFTGTAQVLFGNSKEIFNELVARLRYGDLALVMSGSQLAILLYPAQSKLWGGILGHPKTARSEQNPLSYCILSSLDVPSIPALDISTHAPLPGGRCDLPELMDMYFAWKYDQLLPHARGLNDHDPFYLIFPGKANAAYSTLGRWLIANSTSSDGGTAIYTSRDPGGWTAFLSHGTGTIIVHHSCIRLLRCIPFLATALDQSLKYSVWVLHDLEAPGIPATVQPRYPPLSGAPRLRMVEVFSSGIAILLTPSFLISEPKNTLELLQWCKHQKSESSQHTSCWVLAGAHDLQAYLLELCTEQIKQHDALQGIIADTTMRTLEENKRRISPEFMSKRYEAWKIVEELQGDRLATVDDSLSAVISAPSSIDPNDEQSLVNWFGHWSLLNMDKYRKFYVVGTSRSHWASHLASRAFRIPNFGRRTVADPDRAYARDQPAESINVEPEVDLDESPQLIGKEDLQASELPALNAPNLPGLDPPAGRPVPSASNLFGSESALEFQDHLKRLNERYGMAAPVFWRLYNRPVSWDGDAMQEFFENNYVDRRDNYERYLDWWKYTFPFFDDAPRSRNGVYYNTYIGFFYTLDDETWNPDNYIKGVLPKHKRHPWIAIYRPQMPHSKTEWLASKKCDLLIWDPYADRRFRDVERPSLAELPYMQRRLYEWVNDHTGAKNPRSTLDRIYYGGFEWPECQSSHPLDLTVEFLEAILQDPRRKIPSAQVFLFEKGWKLVETALTAPSAPRSLTSLPLPSPPPPLEETTYAARDPEDISDNEPPYTAEELLDSNLKLVFHAPSARKPNIVGGKSKCRNMLFDMVEKVLKLKAQAKEIRFDYKPTVTWYKDQVEEGRGYSHITVGDWETIKAKLSGEAT